MFLPTSDRVRLPCDVCIKYLYVHISVALMEINKGGNTKEPFIFLSVGAAHHSLICKIIFALYGSRTLGLIRCTHSPKTQNTKQSNENTTIIV